MKSIDIFYQGDGIAEFEQIEIEGGRTVGEVKAIIAARHGLTGDLLIFLEDAEDPLGEQLIIGEVCGPQSSKLHIHRCHKVETAVTFGGETVHHKFAPAKTVGSVKKWAAIHKFGMSEAEAGEHQLQIAGTKDRPAPGTHIGSLAHCPECRVHFDLVPDERVNGASGAVCPGDA